MKTIALAADHRGFELKNQIAEFLKKKKYTVLDCGTYNTDSTDYPDHMIKAAESVKNHESEAAIGICYTGIGSAIAANKVTGVRAALVHSVKEAELSRAHNDSNMLILGAGFLDIGSIFPIVETWLNTPFEGGRHAERVNKIQSYEQKHSR